jgi:predicted short-subunit dehydrogenase-like oxidoreductase (DUF2520 family)
MQKDYTNDIKFGIIGAGSVGKTLALKLFSQNNLGFILARSRKRKEELISAGIPPNLIINEFDDICKIPDIFVIAVNDSSIGDVVTSFSETYNVVLNEKFIFHVSGSKAIQELSPLEKFNYKIFTAHPFQTFTVYKESLLDGLIWGIENGNTSTEEIEKIISILNGKCCFLSQESAEKKELYHLTAVAASNFLVSTLEFSKILFEKSKLTEPKLIEQIVRVSVENSMNSLGKSDQFPLSGPIARADKHILRKHLATLENEGELKSIYNHFSIATAKLLHERGMLSSEECKEIIEIFSEVKLLD